jgi:purine nucleosidase
MAEQIPVIIDTDIGTDVDDAMAILLTLASPELRLLGLTIVDADVETRARIAARLLGLARKPDIPIFKGSSKPIGPGRMPTWLGHEGKGILEVPFSGQEAKVHDTSAVDWIIEQSHKEKLHFFSIGAFTNLAMAIKKDKSITERIDHVTVMGGLVHEEAFSDPWKQFLKKIKMLPVHLDHNTVSDPEAALIVARSGIPMTWVTAELTFCTYLHEDSLKKIRSVGNPLSDALANMLEIWNKEWFFTVPNHPELRLPFPENAIACLHDPLAIASLFHGDFLKLRAHNLQFEIEGPYFKIFEKKDTGEATQDVSVAVDNTKFEKIFVDRVINFMQKVHNK